jgi:transcriptional regulator with XRE-family HTH domain
LWQILWPWGSDSVRSHAMELHSTYKNSHLTDLQRTKFRLWLQKKFTDRCQKNPKYSLRSFSAFLGIDASTVSQILAGKRSPSQKSLLEICERLSATPAELRLLKARRDQAGSDDFHQLSVDTFSVLADWYHYAILELTFVKGFQPEAKWISEQLGISVLETKAALDRLLRLGLLARKKMTLVKAENSVTNHTGVNTSVARKTLQKQLIAKALAAVDDTPQEEKDITSITMAIDPKNLDQAREMIKQFRRDLCALAETGQQKQVYNLGIQLYPISKKQENL